MAAYRQTMLRALKQQLRGGPPPAPRMAAAAQRTFTSGTTHGSHQGDLETALLLKNKIESATVKDLRSSGDLIAEHCKLIDESLDQLAERHLQVARSVRNVTLKWFCTGVVLVSIKNEIDSYYYNKAEFEEEERRLAAEGGMTAVDAYLMI